jgi:hypothetical protein
MATKPAAPSSVLAFGTDPESTLANERWQQAYDQLLQAVEKRQEKPMFDPFWLKIAEAGVAPTNTGNYFETLGNTASAIGKFQEGEQTKAEELAKMRLELAGMGVERASQRAIVQNLAKKAGMAPAGTAPSGAAPSETSPPGAAQPAAKPPEIGEGLEPIGQFPVNPNLIRSEQEFYRRALESGQRDPVAIGKEWVEYQKNFLSPKFEGGNVYDPINGKIYSKTSGGTATTTFMTGQGGSFAIPESAVREHQRLIAAAQKTPNNPEVWDRLETFEDFWRKPQTRPVKAPVVTNIPTEAAQPVAQTPTQSAAPAKPVAQAPAQPVAQAPAQPVAPTRPAAQPPAQVPAAQPGATAAIPPPPQFSAPLRFTSVPRPPGRLSAEQKAAYDAEDKTRLDAALADQKASLDSQQAQYSAALAELKAQEDARRAEEKAQKDLKRDVSKAGQIAEQEITNIPPKKLAEQTAEQEVKARQEIIENRKEADSTITFANQFRKYAELPNAKQMFGILNNQQVSSGIATLVKEAIRVGYTSIGAPAIEDVMRNANMTQQEQAQYRNFLQLSTQLQLQRAKYMKGSVSNFEQTILGNAGIGPQDTPETIRMKSDIMASRAQFDRQVARAFEASKQSAAKFLSSDAYYTMLDEYNQKLSRLVVGETRLQPRPQRSGSAIQNADSLLGIR